jgi:hypothetical protein
MAGSGVLLMMGSYPPGLEVPDVLGTVAAGQDERGEVGVVWYAHKPSGPAGVWMLTCTKAGQLP